MHWNHRYKQRSAHARTPLYWIACFHLFTSYSFLPMWKWHSERQNKRVEKQFLFAIEIDKFVFKKVKRWTTFTIVIKLNLCKFHFKIEIKLLLLFKAEKFASVLKQFPIDNNEKTLRKESWHLTRVDAERSRRPVHQFSAWSADADNAENSFSASLHLLPSRTMYIGRDRQPAAERHLKRPSLCSGERLSAPSCRTGRPVPVGTDRPFVNSYFV